MLTSFGDGGRQPGQFYGVHNLDTDSKGNLYATETYTGARMQRFIYKGVGARRRRRTRACPGPSAADLARVHAMRVRAGSLLLPEPGDQLTIMLRGVGSAMSIRLILSTRAAGSRSTAPTPSKTTMSTIRAAPRGRGAR